MAQTPKKHHIKHKDLLIRIKILMISDSLSNASNAEREKLDRSSKVAESIIQQYGYHSLGVEYLPDEITSIQECVRHYISQNTELILTIGGTGISTRDVTPEAVRPLLQKELPGFENSFDP
ncbi:MAG: MogA/MoaB family molybdenum cofactor biosynthesis protein [Candidatus Helarchaeota archaeon]